MNWNNAVQAVSRGLMFVGIASAVVSASGFRSISSAARPAELMTSDRSSEINVRLNPSVRSQPLHYGYSGDRVQILQQQQGDDEWVWYYVKFDRSGAMGWVRSDLIRRETLSGAMQPSSQATRPSSKVASSAVYPLPQSRVAPPPVSSVATRNVSDYGGGNTTSRSPLPQSPSPQSPLSQSRVAPPPVSSVARRSVPNYPYGTSFTQEQINYFMEIAMGSEFDSSGNSKIRKWQGDVRIQYFGTPTQTDLATLNTVIEEVNGLVGGAIRLQLVQNNPNVRIRFVPEPQFRNYEPRYVPVNFGFFATNWDAKGTIQSANVLINSQGITQKERSHLIREELTQSLGLMRDSYKYSTSMFYQPWTDVTQYAEIDKALIRMLYSPNIQTGMTRTEVLTAMRTLQARSNPSLKF
jgi:hypothetical protein